MGLVYYTAVGVRPQTFATHKSASRVFDEGIAPSAFGLCSTEVDGPNQAAVCIISAAVKEKELMSR